MKNYIQQISFFFSVHRAEPERVHQHAQPIGQLERLSVGQSERRKPPTGPRQPAAGEARDHRRRKRRHQQGQLELLKIIIYTGLNS